MKLDKELVTKIMNYLDEENVSWEDRKNVWEALDNYEYFIGENPKAIYNFHFDCGRMGDLTGSFVAEKKEIEWLINSGLEVYFGEVLGKHSEIHGPIDSTDITMISDDFKLTKNHTNSGYNPLHYTAIGVKEEWQDLTIQEIIEHESSN